MIPIERDKIAGIRVSLDKQIAQIKVLRKASKYQEAQERLAVAEELFEELKSFLDTSNQTHIRILNNRMNELETLDTYINNGLDRREAGKKEDGNVAFKCNWNDANYKDVCSDEAYAYNRRQMRLWCLHSRCREFVGKPAPTDLKKDACYEARALVNCYFGAGWDNDENGKMIRPRKIQHARVNKIALLTTETPDDSERMIVGAFRIDKIQEDPGYETMIFGDKNTYLDDMLRYQIRFWNYYSNPNKPDSKVWASGLVRYLGDKAILGILEEYRDKKIKESGDVSKVDQLILSLKD